MRHLMKDKEHLFRMAALFVVGVIVFNSVVIIPFVIWRQRRAKRKLRTEASQLATQCAVVGVDRCDQFDW